MKDREILREAVAVAARYPDHNRQRPLKTSGLDRLPHRVSELAASIVNVMPDDPFEGLR